MPNTHRTLKSLFSDTADSIRAKKGSSDPIVADNFPAEIASIPTGGGTPIPENDVTFYDYDGTVVASYTAAEFAQLEAMPPNPSHEGLTAQGWNWDLADAKEYVADYGGQNIAQMYVTDDGKTRLYIEIPKGTPSNRMTVRINYYQTVANGVTINWGDGTAETTEAESGECSPTHTYASIGKYIISMQVNSGVLQFGNGTSGISMPLKSYVVKVEVGLSVKLRGYAFSLTPNMKTISISNGTTSGAYTFTNCSTIKFIGLPKTISELDYGMFRYNYGLEYISIAKEARIAVSTTAIFENCYSLKNLWLPPSVAGIGQSVCRYMYSLTRIVIPASVTSIRTQAFQNSTTFGEIKFTRATPPTVAESAFGSLPTDCVIYVPSESLNDYKAAQNYPDPQTYRYVEY